MRALAWPLVYFGAATDRDKLPPPPFTSLYSPADHRAGAVTKKRAASASSRPASSVVRPKLTIVEDEPAGKPAAGGGCCGK